MTTGYLDAAKATHTRLFPTEKAQVIPCTESEVLGLEHSIGSRLPDAYREFLLWMGKHGGDFWSGYHAFYGNLRDANVWARELIRSSGTRLSLPRDAFMFFWDVAQLFHFFVTTEGNDPPVYAFLDPDLERVIRNSSGPEKLSPAQSYLVYLFDDTERDTFVLRAPSFSEYLVSEIEEHARASRLAGLWR